MASTTRRSLTERAHTRYLRGALRAGKHDEAKRHAMAVAGVRGDPKRWGSVYEQEMHRIGVRGNPHTWETGKPIDRFHDLRNGGLFLLGAVAPNRIDALVPYRPLGESMPPSLMAVPLLFFGAWLAKRYKRPRLASGLKVLGLGLLAGCLGRAVARRVSAA